LSRRSARKPGVGSVYGKQRFKEATAEGGCATRVSIGSQARVPVPHEIINRRRGLLYPIKPEPGLIGAQPAVPQTLKRPQPRAAPPQQMQKAHSPGTPVLCHTSIDKVTGKSACATNAKGIGFFRDRARVELPETILSAMKILGIRRAPSTSLGISPAGSNARKTAQLRLRAHLQSNHNHCRGASLRKAGGGSVSRGRQRVADFLLW
jgi:hypothetical protein